ncbi:protein spinster isoform X1 [Drosophila novamexicana]|uniref:protein spinster isoform X1 n=1 Tax=Drosophila novamexicana TaxID=47314 RepID=UPI0011E5CBEA|nr:protein spinster isoform X1 [Drosophila novamexicana]
MSLKNHPAYQPLPTAAAAMDNPAMSNSSSSSGSNDDVAALAQSGLPATYSSQQLVSSDSDSMERRHLRGNSIVDEPGSRLARMGHFQWFTVATLCFVNLINYMDRFTIAGVLTEVKEDFQIDNDNAGLLQTAFVISYMIFAPLFGYLGDRYSRRWLMAVGVALWSTTTLLGSYMHTYGWFITFRALVGIGEASYSTIAPTIISDLFVNSMRSKMLAMFYFAIPVGSGLGYIVGSKTAQLANNWRWALRVTPILGVIAVVLILLIKDPKRGESEGQSDMEPTSFCIDIKELLKNRSFMLSTAGFTCVAFVAGALAWWGPTYIHLGLKMQPGNENLQLDDVAFKFGLITMIAGVVGVPLGAILSQALMKRWLTSDPVICAIGLLLSAPLLTGACLIVSSQTILTYILIFFGQLAINVNWAIVADMLLYVVVPTRRSTAEAFQILISHALGDAGSPYLVGVLSVAIRKHLSSATSKFISPNSMQSLSQVLENATETVTETITDMSYPRAEATDEVLSFESLQYSLFSTTFVEVLGGIFFLLTACFIIRDKSKATSDSLGNDLRSAPRQTNPKLLFDSDCLVMCTDIAMRERA